MTVIQFQDHVNHCGTVIARLLHNPEVQGSKAAMLVFFKCFKILRSMIRLVFFF